MERHNALSNMEAGGRIDSFITLRMDDDEPTTLVLEGHRSGASIEHWEDESILALDRPRLPVELMVVISEFLLGDRLFGTLASLNRTCHAVQQETAPVLNETLVLDTGTGWWNDDNFRAEGYMTSDITGRIWKQTRYVFSEKGELFHRRNDLFPNLKVWIIKHSETSGTFPVSLPVCTAELVIHKPVGLDTLWDLLRLYSKWEANGARYQIPIQGISKVRLEKDGQITGPLDSPDDYLRFLNPCYRTDLDLIDAVSSPPLARTMMHLSRLMQPSQFLCTRRNDQSDFMEGVMADRVLGFELGDDDGVYYDLLPALETILTRGISLDVKVEHSETSSIGQRKIVARMNATTEMYSTHFPIIQESRINATADDAFFVMRAPQALSDVQLEALDDDYQWPRTLYGHIFLENNAIWVHAESGSMGQDNYDLVNQTIQL